MTRVSFSFILKIDVIDRSILTFNTTIIKDLSLYIHIPFCKTICLYCNFVTFAHKNKWIPEYIKAVQKEITHQAHIYKGYKVETIYFGGGTPSLIEAKQLETILNTIKKNFAVSQQVEINVECNPESIDQKKLSDYYQMGVNRISLGVQTLNKAALRRIARPHDDKKIFEALEAIKASPIKNFGTDVIMGLPYQTLKSFKAEISKLLSYKPTHFSAYFLSYDTKKIDLFIKECPQEDTQIEMYEWLVKKLKQAGLEHYEVSNYARKGYQCKHNLRYWKQQEYLGFGVGAHSYIDHSVYENTSNFDEYLKNPESSRENMHIDPQLDHDEYILLSLRTKNGINKAAYLKRFSKYDKLLEKAKEYQPTDHLKITNRAITPTDKGFLIIDKITKDLIDI